MVKLDVLFYYCPIEWHCSCFNLITYKCSSLDKSRCSAPLHCLP
ncbi:hypothetical protein BVRB_1g006400 [Beta vulgaris subsp. vulgaris]|nr:hypothetical protein BVRB_1g006400 [Beta vulgaris subsp. vulgaris]